MEIHRQETKHNGNCFGRVTATGVKVAAVKVAFARSMSKLPWCIKLIASLQQTFDRLPTAGVRWNNIFFLVMA